jgi:hypothetical protein
LIGSEGFQVNGRALARHRGEFLPGDESALVPRRDQLPYPVAVPRDGE